MTELSSHSCRILANPEHLASTWWDYARANYQAPAVIRPMLEILGPLEIHVSAADGNAVQDWARAIPDWDDTAPPLLFDWLDH
jgi:hypothetical protein